MGNGAAPYFPIIILRFLVPLRPLRLCVKFCPTVRYGGFAFACVSASMAAANIAADAKSIAA